MTLSYSERKLKECVEDFESANAKLKRYEEELAKIKAYRDEIGFYINQITGELFHTVVDEDAVDA